MTISSFYVEASGEWFHVDITSEGEIVAVWDDDAGELVEVTDDEAAALKVEIDRLADERRDRDND